MWDTVSWNKCWNVSSTYCTFTVVSGLGESVEDRISALKMIILWKKKTPRWNQVKQLTYNVSQSTVKIKKKMYATEEDLGQFRKEGSQWRLKY